MAVEIPIRCDNCGNEQIIYGNIKVGRLNGLMGNLGGPGQDPPTMGNQWAVYICPQCDGIFPFKKHYGGQMQLQSQYDQLMKFFKQRMEKKNQLEDLAKKLESIQQASKSLSTLPGISNHEARLSSMLEPMMRRIQELEAELQRRKGGRPKKSKNKETK